MSFSLEDRWIWDFWVADDGHDFHLYYLSAPKSLGDPDLRHRNATIGHATGSDLTSWTDHGVVLTPGGEGAIDETATWTGSVMREPNGRWRMFYTGSRFLSPNHHRNVETVGAAVSDDLHHWTKLPSLQVRADAAHYETLNDGTWHEEAWRDPWVYRHGSEWRMLITARARRESHRSEVRDAGVVGIAHSRDLDQWQVAPAASSAGAGFGHLEVLQPFSWHGREFVMFSCDTAHLAGERAARGERGGVWVAPVAGERFEIDRARLLVDESLYAGRLVTGRTGEAFLMGFVNTSPEGGFGGQVSDPLPLATDTDGWPVVASA